MNNIVKPDYNNCILNITSSILKTYNVKSSYKSLSELDRYLSNSYKNVVLMVFDGMGINVLENTLPKDSFLRKHIKSEVTSVFPSTTTAAMTAFYSGLSPKEHGWLGWSLYFKEFNGCIDTYTNLDSFKKISVSEKHAAYTLMPYRTIFEKIDQNTNGSVEIYTIVPSGIILPEKPNKNFEVNSIEKICQNIEKICTGGNRKFIMTYWFEPDATIHKRGCNDENVRNQIKNINECIENMCLNLDDTTVIITADHGLINITEEVHLNDIPEIDECLIMPPSIESRAASLFVKPEMLGDFEKRFNEHFKNDFILMKKEEILNSGILGCGQTHKKVLDFVGDYIACAIGYKMIRYSTYNAERKQPYKGQHAGLTREEMLVPLIVVD